VKVVEHGAATFDVVLPAVPDDAGELSADELAKAAAGVFNSQAATDRELPKLRPARGCS
jgi:hypothetical protein